MILAPFPCCLKSPQISTKHHFEHLSNSFWKCMHDCPKVQHRVLLVLSSFLVGCFLVVALYVATWIGGSIHRNVEALDVLRPSWRLVSTSTMLPAGSKRLKTGNSCFPAQLRANANNVKILANLPSTRQSLLFPKCPCGTTPPLCASKNSNNIVSTNGKKLKSAVLDHLKTVHKEFKPKELKDRPEVVFVGKYSAKARKKIFKLIRALGIGYPSASRSGSIRVQLVQTPSEVWDDLDNVEDLKSWDASVLSSIDEEVKSGLEQYLIDLIGKFLESDEESLTLPKWYLVPKTTVHSILRALELEEVEVKWEGKKGNKSLTVVRRDQPSPVKKKAVSGKSKGTGKKKKNSNEESGVDESVEMDDVEVELAVPMYWRKLRSAHKKVGSVGVMDLHCAHLSQEVRDELVSVSRAVGFKCGVQPGGVVRFTGTREEWVEFGDLSEYLQCRLELLSDLLKTEMLDYLREGIGSFLESSFTDELEVNADKLPVSLQWVWKDVVGMLESDYFDTLVWKRNMGPPAVLVLNKKGSEPDDLVDNRRNLPSLDFEGEVVCASTTEEIDTEIDRLYESGANAISLGVQKDGEKIGLIQLCYRCDKSVYASGNGYRCVLFHISNTPLSPKMWEFLTDDHFAKAMSEVGLLVFEHAEVQVANGVPVNEFLVMIEGQESEWDLERMAARFLGVYLDVPSQDSQFDMWTGPKLTKRQVRTGSLEAFACLRLFEMFLSEGIVEL